MRREIDAAGKTGDDHEPGAAESTSQAVREGKPRAEALREPTIATAGPLKDIP